MESNGRNGAGIRSPAAHTAASIVTRGTSPSTCCPRALNLHSIPVGSRPRNGRSCRTKPRATLAIVTCSHVRWRICSENGCRPAARRALEVYALNVPSPMLRATVHHVMVPRLRGTDWVSQADAFGGITAGIDAAVHVAFALPRDLPTGWIEEIKAADMLALRLERDAWMCTPPREWPPLPEPPIVTSREMPDVLWRPAGRRGMLTEGSFSTHLRADAHAARAVGETTRHGRRDAARVRRGVPFSRVGAGRSAVRNVWENKYRWKDAPGGPEKSIAESQERVVAVYANDPDKARCARGAAHGARGLLPAGGTDQRGRRNRAQCYAIELLCK